MNDVNVSQKGCGQIAPFAHPHALMANALLWTTRKSRRRRLKPVTRSMIRDGYVAWRRIAGWFVPYQWSESLGIWVTQDVSSLGFDRVSVPEGRKKTNIAVCFSSECTASSPEPAEE